MGGALSAAFERVLAAGCFVLGEEVERFEAEFADYCGVRYCVGTSSGTAALMLSLRAAGVGSGDEVLVPAHTFAATPFAVLLAGAEPVFVDVDVETGLIRSDAAAAAVTPRTSALIAVHLYGQPCAMDELRSLAGASQLLLVEDAAQAHGAQFCGGRVGSLGDVAAFSFYPSKNLGGLGDSGGLVTNDPVLAEQARALRNLGQARKGRHGRVSGNDRLDSLQAAFLRAKLPQLDEWNTLRSTHAAQYRAALEGVVALSPDRPGAVAVHHLFPIRVASRDAVAANLRARGIGAAVHYSPTAAWQPPFEPPRDCPGAEQWQRDELSLPLFPELERGQVEAVTAGLLAVLGPR
jgi:dTDP-3-amino-3,4,6-trideoxy-alpha-D-glucose transaminase